jgi:hypothetical protein
VDTGILPEKGEEQEQPDIQEEPGMIAGAVVLKSGRIIQNNVIVEVGWKGVYVVHSSSSCEPNAPRDRTESIPYADIDFITAWSFDSPYIYMSFSRMVEIAKDQVSNKTRATRMLA